MRVEYHYIDSEGNPTTKENGKQVEVIDFDNDDNVVGTEWLVIKKDV